MHRPTDNPAGEVKYLWEEFPFEKSDDYKITLDKLLKAYEAQYGTSEENLTPDDIKEIISICYKNRCTSLNITFEIDSDRGQKKHAPEPQHGISSEGQGMNIVYNLNAIIRDLLERAYKLAPERAREWHGILQLQGIQGHEKPDLKDLNEGPEKERIINYLNAVKSEASEWLTKNLRNL